jgi:hypothetical protein
MQLIELYAIVVKDDHTEGVLRFDSHGELIPLIADSVDELRRFFSIADEFCTDKPNTSWSIASWTRGPEISKCELTIPASEGFNTRG